MVGGGLWSCSQIMSTYPWLATLLQTLAYIVSMILIIDVFFILLLEIIQL